MLSRQISMDRLRVAALKSQQAGDRISKCVVDRHGVAVLDDEPCNAIVYLDAVPAEVDEYNRLRFHRLS